MCSLILPFAIYLRFLTAGQRDAVIVAQEAVSGGWCTARARAQAVDAHGAQQQRLQNSAPQFDVRTSPS